MEYYDTDDNVKRVVDMLRSVKKSKTKKAQMFYGAFGGDDEKYYKTIVDLANQNCPHATKIYAGFSVDVVWDLPSGNHPGLFINEHGKEGAYFFTCGMTAWKYIDFPENTPDGKMPAEMEALARQMYEQSNGGGLSENDLASYMQQMDELCARLQSIQKSKASKGTFSDLERFIDVHHKEANKEKYGEGYLTDDGWYDDQRYTIVNYNKIKVANRVFTLSTLGSTVVYKYWKSYDTYAYRISISIPYDLSDIIVDWEVVDEDGNTVQTGSPIYVRDGEPSAVAEELSRAVRDCASEADRFMSSIEKSKTKKSYESDERKDMKHNLSEDPDYIVDIEGRARYNNNHAWEYIFGQYTNGNISREEYVESVIDIALYGGVDRDRRKADVEKSKTKKDEKKVPISDDDTVEIEEMNGEKYVEIEPKEEHAEEVETGYEKESDDLNTEDNVTHPDESKPKETEKSKTKKGYRVIGYGSSHNPEELIAQSKENYQDARNPIIRYATSNDSLDGSPLSAKIFDSLEDAQKELAEWTAGLSASGFAFSIIDENDNVIKSKTEKALIDFEEGMTVKDFFDRNKRGGNSIHGFDLYSVHLDGKQVGTNYTGVTDYADYIVDSYEMDDFLGLLDINIHKSVKDAGELTPEQAVQKLAKYQQDNKRNGLMQDEVYELTGFNAETLFQPMLRKGRVRRIKCADGFMYDIKG